MTSPTDTPKETAPRKVEARLPRGFGDRGPAELAAMRGMLEKIRTTFELYGFEAVETPFLEYTEALGKFLPDLDRPNEGVFSFQDDDDQWLSLRYDLTAPLARYVAEHFDALPKPYRSYRNGYVFRNEKPGPGRFRQFMQFDADTVGAPGVSADAEMCMLMADTLEAVGIKRGDYVIKVNNRKVLDGVMEAIGLAGEENAARRLIVLRAIDKLDKVGPDGVFALLGDGRLDVGVVAEVGEPAGDLEILFIPVRPDALVALGAIAVAQGVGIEGCLFPGENPAGRNGVAHDPPPCSLSPGFPQRKPILTIRYVKSHPERWGSSRSGSPGRLARSVDAPATGPKV